MEFDVKKYFPRKEGFGDTVLSIPEMQAEIARLQAEVERTNDVLESQAHVIRDLRSKLDTAWNDAIEAAASMHDKMSDDFVAFMIKHRGACMEYEENNHPKYASAIRALHRPT